MVAKLSFNYSISSTNEQLVTLRTNGPVKFVYELSKWKIWSIYTDYNGDVNTSFYNVFSLTFYDVNTSY